MSKLIQPRGEFGATIIDAEDKRQVRAYYACLIAVSVILCLPIWATEYLPLVDYPNHLARAYVLHYYNDTNAFQTMYALIVEPIPNLAIDIIVPALMWGFTLETAGKIFLTLTVLLFSYGCHLLGMALHNRPTWLAIICALFTYNSSFLYGFVNYQFGLGMFLVTLAVWLRYRHRWNLSSFLGVCGLVLASYLSHLSAYVFLGIALCIVTLYDCLTARCGRRQLINAAFGLAPLTLPLIAFIIFMRSGGAVGAIDWNTIQGKFINSLSLILSYNYRLDAVAACIIAGVVLMLAVYARCVESERAVLLVGGCFAICFLLCPRTLFTSSGADARFIPAAALMALLSLKFTVPRHIGICALSIVLCIALVRWAGIWHMWSAMSQRVSSQVQMFEHLPEGTRVYPLFFDDWIKENKTERPFEHSINYATIYRRAFVPTLFALRGQQPLIFRDKPFFQRINHTTPLDEVNWKAIFSGYDYVWCDKLDDKYLQFIANRCQLIVEADGFRIYRINANALESVR